MQFSIISKFSPDRKEPLADMLVANLAALVAEFDRSYVPAIEAATADPPSERAPA